MNIDDLKGYKKYKQALKNNELAEMFVGNKNEYTLYEKNSYYWNEITDTDVLLKHCIFPLYSDGYTDVVLQTESTLLQMAKSNNPLQIFQVYNFIASFCTVKYLYDNVPFNMDFTQIIGILLERRSEFFNLIQECEINENNQNVFFRIWEISCNIITGYSAFKDYIKNNKKYADRIDEYNSIDNSFSYCKYANKEFICAILHDGKILLRTNDDIDFKNLQFEKFMRANVKELRIPDNRSWTLFYQKEVSLDEIEWNYTKGLFGKYNNEKVQIVSEFADGYSLLKGDVNVPENFIPRVPKDSVVIIK